MENLKFKIYVQLKPEDYVGDGGITIYCKKSESWAIDIIKLHLLAGNEMLSGVEFEDIV